MSQADNFEPVVLVGVSLKNNVHLTIAVHICEIDWVPLRHARYVYVRLLKWQFSQH